MKHLKKFNEDLSYSGKDVTKMPIIGTVMTKPIAHYPAAEYNVVEIIETETGIIYVSDSWYKRSIPQLIPESLVETYNEI
jgi:hypothetical protein